MSLADYQVHREENFQMEPRRVMEKGIASYSLPDDVSLMAQNSFMLGRFETTPPDITGNASGGLLSGRNIAKRVLQTFATFFNQVDHWKIQ